MHFERLDFMLLPEWSERRCPVIGMLHAPPLPGSPGYGGRVDSIRQMVLRDAESLTRGGVDGLMIENFGDTPFFPGRVPAVTVATMTALAMEIRAKYDIPLGINLLRNDGQSALAVAVACDAAFIRVNVLCGARVADQGVLQAIAHDLLRDRAFLHAKSIRIWADVDVKHSASLAQRPIKDEVHDLIDRGHCDAVIVSGIATGAPTDLETLKTVKACARSTPVIVGSGVDAESIRSLAPFADALIVGTSLKEGGDPRKPVDLERVRRIMEAVRATV